MGPEAIADYVRVKLLIKYGGIWLDMDYLIYSDISYLFQHLDIWSSYESILIDEYENKHGNSVIISRQNSSAMNMLLHYIDRYLDGLESRYKKGYQYNFYSALGPELIYIMLDSYRASDLNLLIVNGTSSEKSINFIGWQKNPTYDFSIWYKTTTLEAKAKALDIIDSLPGFGIVATWNLYKIADDILDIPLLLLHDNHSVFFHLLHNEEDFHDH
jgi:mannosyltransferase OCH1-like enzyme